MNKQAKLCVNKTFDMLAKVKKLTNVDSKDIYKTSLEKTIVWHLKNI